MPLFDIRVRRRIRYTTVVSQYVDLLVEADGSAAAKQLALDKAIQNHTDTLWEFDEDGRSYQQIDELVTKPEIDNVSVAKVLREEPR